ncbi:MAG TPA: hypothetical protein H9829_11075 [Candidatus Tetragenococcus pullicola]|nr:hypothetical protein [Candidatus Tetragenococcus pullicola]
MLNNKKDINRELFDLLKNNQPFPNSIFTQSKMNDLNKNVINSKEIYAIIACWNHPQLSIIIYEKKLEFVDCPIDSIVNKLIKTKYNFEPRLYFQALKKTFGKNLRGLPFACQKFSLVFFNQQEQSKRCWVNPAKIISISKSPKNSHHILELANNISIVVKRQLPSIYQKVEKGIFAQAIMKRECVATPRISTIKLIDYLEIPSTILTRELFQFTTFEDIPGKPHDFSTYYYELKQQRDTLLQEEKQWY